MDEYRITGKKMYRPEFEVLDDIFDLFPHIKKPKETETSDEYIPKLESLYKAIKRCVNGKL